MRRSLRTRLTLSFLVAIATTAALVVLLANLITTSQFRGFVSHAGQQYAKRLAPLFADHYIQTGGWDGVEDLMAYVHDTNRKGPPGTPGPRNMMPRSGVVEPEGERLILVDLDGNVIADSRAGKPIILTGKEYALLEYLMRNRGRVVSQSMIIEHVWDMNYEGSSNVVNVYINHLRDKIDKDAKVKLIKTIRGHGYKIDED